MKTKWLLSFIIIGGLMLGPLYSPVFALSNNITILTADEIKKMTDDDLKKAYVDVLIELEAETIFYGRAGFLKKDLDEYRELIRYRVTLMFELQDRKLDVPKILP